MNIQYLPLISFVLITTFTPGPNNISCASLGILYGYRKTLGYMLGICSGFFLMMLACAFISSTLLRMLPSVEPYLRVGGTVYILWLAYCTARSAYTFKNEERPLFDYKKGFVLQAVNPKAIIYGITIYATFLAPLANSPFLLMLSAGIFSCITFVAISAWTTGGAFIRSHLAGEKMRIAANAIMVILLIYTAADLSGMFH